MKRYGVLFSLIMVGSMAAMNDEEEKGNFLRRSDSIEISPRRESLMPPFDSFPGTLAIRASLRRVPQDREEVLVRKEQEERETHALFEFVEPFFDE